MKEVNRREFIQYTSKYLKELPLKIINNKTGKHLILMTADEVATTKEKEVATQVYVATYGCGCKKEQGKTLCNKHGRL